MVRLCLWWILAWSAIAFAVCGWDKRCARKGCWRVPERVLWGLSAVGGAAGMLLGMGTFRHKTRHWTFVWGVPSLLLAQLAAVAFLTARQ